MSAGALPRWALFTALSVTGGALAAVAVDESEPTEVPGPLDPSALARTFTPEQAGVFDVALTASIRLRLLQQHGLSGARVTVATRDRVVRLGGVVERDDDRARAVAIAAGTHGVASVVDEITVAQTRSGIEAAPRTP